jgi:glutaredoxin
MTDTIIVYGATWCPDCGRARQFFGEHRIDYEWIDITDNAEAVAFVEQANQGSRRSIKPP